jgi:hypothetical protein
MSDSYDLEELVVKFSTIEGNNQAYYIVIRGVVPGIYSRITDLLDNVCDVKGAHVQRFPTLATAIAAWRQALTDGQVVPLDNVTHVQLLLPHLHYPVARQGDVEVVSTNATVLTNLSVCKHARTSLETAESSAALSVGDGDEWRRVAYEYSPKWVVWRGRLPGILDSWYETTSIMLYIECS